MSAPAALKLPPEILSQLRGTELHDRTFSPRARTFLLTRADSTRYLKIAPKGELVREAEMTKFLHGHGLAPEVLAFVQNDMHDHMLTMALPGHNGIHPDHLANPRWLAECYGRSLRRLHSLDPTGCPFPLRNDEMLALADRNLRNGIFDATHLKEPHDVAASRIAIRPELDHVVMHGDYCLPNLILSDARLSGFIDLGNGGLGDRHYDLYWGLWALAYNLKTERFHQDFLAAYGYDAIDPDRLAFFRIVSAFMN